MDPPLSGREKFVILRRLDKVIQHRLISKAYPLPERMRRVRIRNGMAIFEVPGEFQAALTLLGELPITPWTLLNVKILVKDEEIGEGQELIHPNQLWFLHNLVQGR
jgi:mediator of RNA polymerase II transcription subunit 14